MRLTQRKKPAVGPVALYACVLQTAESGGFSECHDRFESVAAGVAGPQVANAAFVLVLGPLRHEQRFAALRAVIGQP